MTRRRSPAKRRLRATLRSRWFSNSRAMSRPRIQTPHATSTGAPPARTSSIRDLSCSCARRCRRSSAICCVASARRRGSRASTLPRRWPGRTWLQQATPITFGLKAAGWLDALDRQRLAIEAALHDASVLQFGGASGTLAVAGRPRCGRCRASGRHARAGVCRHPVARASRPARPAGVCARHRVRRVRKDRARHRPPGADRGRRVGGSARRRLVDDAAQAESGEGVGRARGVRPRAGPGGDDARRDAAGARTGARRVAGRMGGAARARARHRRRVTAPSRPLSRRCA